MLQARTMRPNRSESLRFTFAPSPLHRMRPHAVRFSHILKAGAVFVALAYLVSVL